VELRDRYPALQAAGVQVVVLGPDRPGALAAYFEKEHLPFLGIADPDQHVLKAFGQQYRWYTMGLLPTMVAIAPDGHIVWRHSSSSPTDLPSLDEAVAALGRVLGA